MDNDLSVKVSREGTITMIVPELENKLSAEQARLLAGLLNGAVEDGKDLARKWAEQSAILKPYNTTGKKISERASKIRDIEAPGTTKPVLVDEEKEKK